MSNCTASSAHARDVSSLTNENNTVPSFGLRPSPPCKAGIRCDRSYFSTFLFTNIEENLCGKICITTLPTEWTALPARKYSHYIKRGIEIVVSRNADPTQHLHIINLKIPETKYKFDCNQSKSFSSLSDKRHLRYSEITVNAKYINNHVTFINVTVYLSNGVAPPSAAFEIGF